MDKLVALLGTPLFALLCALIFAGLAAGGKTCPSLIFFERDHLLVELIDSALKVSTCIRDKDGNLIAEMIRNEWKVARPPKTWMDHGVGIFEKIMKHFNLADAREALLELSKGQLTSDPRNHSVEGIFFMSRIFDYFYIRSGDLFYSRERMDEGDWLIETIDKPNFEIGTALHMDIATNATWTPREVYDPFQNEDIGFRKTHVPVKLGKYPGEQLVSRSQ